MRGGARPHLSSAADVSAPSYMGGGGGGNVEEAVSEAFFLMSPAATKRARFAATTHTHTLLLVTSRYW